MKEDVILEIKDLVKTFPVPTVKMFERKKIFTALNKISFDIRKGETVGLIGESGCGKTTVGRIIARLLDPDAGQIIFEGKDITSSTNGGCGEEKNKIQMIFQDPNTALNPQFRIDKILKEALISIGIKNKEEQNNRISELISKVGMTEEYLERYPHELSGGQKQRVCILLALLTNPTFIVADEVVSALDLSVQAQILNLMKRLQNEFKLTILFISHDLNIIHYMSDRIIVMYMGEIVESGPCEEVYSRGLHPYTKLLLSSLLDLNSDRTYGETRDNGDVLRGEKFCIYYPRCPISTEVCTMEKPRLLKVGEDHYVKCHHILSEEGNSK